ncbi:MAG: Fmu (Sun) domain-containing protein [Chitinophagaceae bacterium]|nr:Fmu (Sun) domain-containing protein [Chitinophagaceae bacterium]
MKYDNQLRYASEIVKEYDGKIPLSAWLKNYFRLHKQMGSTDRKTISEMAYGFYRLGHNPGDDIEQRILWFIFHSENIPPVKDYFISKGQVPSFDFSVEKIFPFATRLSPGIHAQQFSKSFLVKPDLFIRARPGHQQRIVDILNNNNIRFQRCGDSCFALPNSTKIESLIELDKEAVVQDKSSQQTGEYMKLVAEAAGTPFVWDCCAASGGKSILARDVFEKIELTVSDIRESIIHNLRARFDKAGIKNYTSFIADLNDSRTRVPSSAYDLVIADVPCSGSGTWARTPEQLYFFKEDKIGYYSRLQKQIVSRVIPSIKNGGYLLYITCSVFSDENENNVEYFREKFGLQVVKSGLIEGYSQKADTLFAALFTNQ